MARPRLSKEKLFEISVRCAEVFHTYDGDAPTLSLVAASGLSERTFFRYFPTKPDCIRPLLDAGNRRFAEVTSQHLVHGTANHLDAVSAAIVETFTTNDHPGAGRLMRLVLTVPPLRRVWLESNEDLPALLWPIFAEALVLPEDHHDTLMAADEAVLLAVCTLRVMTRESAPPQEAVDDVIAAFRRNPLERGGR